MVKVSVWDACGVKWWAAGIYQENFADPFTSYILILVCNMRHFGMEDLDSHLSWSKKQIVAEEETKGSDLPLASFWL
jgi:hypothetical protein